MAQLLKYDSIYKTFNHEVTIKDDILTVDNKNIRLFNQKEPDKLDIKKLDIDIMLQCSGVHLTIEKNQPYIREGVKKIVISAPASDEIPTYIYGINHQKYQDEKIISNSSCSANAIVPIFDIIQKHFGIKKAFMSMFHSYTAYQKLLDTKHYSKDIRRTRSATQNIIPLDSSAAEATSKFFPHLKNKLYAKSIRVPVESCTFYDLSINLSQKTSHKKIVEILQKEIQNSTILNITKEPLVSRDFIQSPYSATIDLNFTQLLDGDFLKVSAWQDNEYGYTKRLLDMALIVATKSL
jgi:glyceraldehyde 3-phosphate dehydrogenase